MRAGGARFGSMQLGRPIAGDGRTTATFELETGRGGRATLRVTLDEDSGAVTAAELRAAAREKPPEAW
jgi:hypothetical protein